ncbi:MAG: LamG domain-containing protein [Pedobacter sp.]|nr:MAG: LamG domain-containing protein [Pedobacter sp.]
MIFNKGSFATPISVVWGSGMTAAGKLNMLVADPTVSCGSLWVDNPSDDVLSSNNFLPNTWIHVVLVYNMGVELMYVNGVLNAAKVDDYSYLKACNTANLKIGGWWQNDVVSIQGRLDEMRFYDRVLAENEIEKLAEERL